jgi:hypothetical protein
VLRRLRQEDHKFKASLDYIVRPCLKKATTAQKKYQLYISSSKILEKSFQLTPSVRKVLLL